MKFKRRSQPRDFDSTGHVGRARRHATSRIPVKAILHGAAVGALVGVTASWFGPSLRANPLAVLLHGLALGVPTGAMVGAFASSIFRKPPRR